MYAQQKFSVVFKKKKKLYFHFDCRFLDAVNSSNYPVNLPAILLRLKYQHADFDGYRKIPRKSRTQLIPDFAANRFPSTERIYLQI